MVRLEFVDYAKGLAILLVVIGHLLQYNLVGTSAKELFDIIYSFHMPLFMFLSGYVASLSIGKYLSRKVEYIQKKVYSLVVPFVFMGGLNMLLYKHISMEYILNLFRNPDNGLWFLIVLFCIQLWYLALEYVCSKLKCNKRYLIEGFVGVVFIAMIIVLNKINHEFSGLYTSPIFYVMFFAGSYAAKFLEPFVKSDIVLLLSMIGFIVLVPKFHMWQCNSSLLSLSISLFASIIILRIAMALEKGDVKSDKLLLFGKSSLVIYIFHFYLIKILIDIKIDTSDVSVLPLFVALGVIAFFVSDICVRISNVISQNRLFNFLVLGRKIK